MVKLNSFDVAAIALLGVLILIGVVIALSTSEKEQDKIYYVKDVCSECGQGEESVIIGRFRNEIIQVSVKGTIYKNIGNYTIYASCTDTSEHGIASNATVIIYDLNNQSYINWTNMSTFDGYNHKLVGVLPIEAGVYYIVVNCTASDSWSLGFAEFQVPDWLIELLNTTNHTEQYVVVILNNTRATVNITNTTLDWVGKMMEYWGIKKYTCLNIYSDVPKTANRGDTWEIHSWVTDEYNSTMASSDVSCNISTNFWGVNPMSYSVVTEKFIYWNYLNNSGILEYNVTCEEIGKTHQELC